MVINFFFDIFLLTCHLFLTYIEIMLNKSNQRSPKHIYIQVKSEFSIWYNKGEHT